MHVCFTKKQHLPLSLAPELPRPSLTKAFIQTAVTFARACSDMCVPRALAQGATRWAMVRSTSAAGAVLDFRYCGVHTPHPCFACISR